MSHIGKEEYKIQAILTGVMEEIATNNQPNDTQLCLLEKIIKHMTNNILLNDNMQ